MFFAERGAKAPEALTADPVDVKKVAVVGGGTMGSGIAYACLSAGLASVFLETDDDGLSRARSNVDKIIAASLSRGLITQDRADKLAKHITYSTDYADACDAELAIEAAFESMDVKRDVLQSLEKIWPRPRFWPRIHRI